MRKPDLRLLRQPGPAQAVSAASFFLLSAGLQPSLVLLHDEQTHTFPIT